jgi:hypothetical protein
MGPSPCATGAIPAASYTLTALRNRACPLATATKALDPHRALDEFKPHRIERCLTHRRHTLDGAPGSLGDLGMPQGT